MQEEDEAVKRIAQLCLGFISADVVELPLYFVSQSSRYLFICSHISVDMELTEKSRS